MFEISLNFKIRLHAMQLTARLVDAEKHYDPGGRRDGVVIFEKLLGLCGWRTFTTANHTTSGNVYEK